MPLDLLALAGGREAVFPAAYSRAPSVLQAPSAIVLKVLALAETRLVGELMASLVELHEMHLLMNGERPRGPSDEADAWDEAFETEALPAIEKFAALGGLSQQWIVSNLAGNLRADAEILHTTANHVVGAMIANTIDSKPSVNKKLSAFGITPAEIEEAWLLLGSDQPLASPPERYDFLSEVDTTQQPRMYAPEDTTQAAVIHKPEMVPALPQPTVLATLGEGKDPPKRRTRSNPNATYTLPASIFVDLRAVGVSDKEAADATGIPRSTYNRISSGVAEEIGLTDEQAGRFIEFAVGKRRQMDMVIAALGVYGLAAI